MPVDVVGVAPLPKPDGQSGYRFEGLGSSESLTNRLGNADKGVCSPVPVVVGAPAVVEGG